MREYDIRFRARRDGTIVCTRVVSGTKDAADPIIYRKGGVRPFRGALTPEQWQGWERAVDKVGWDK